MNFIAAISCGIDFTAHDVQDHAKTNGLAWSIAKGIDQFAPISTFKPMDCTN